MGHEPTYWDDIGAQFRSAASHQLWRRHSDEVNGRLLDRWLPAAGSRRILKTDVFDEATGDGLCSRLLDNSAVVCGIDLSVGTLRAAAGRTPGIRTVAADVRSLPFADGAFDCIISNSTLDHFESRRDIGVSLHELARSLKPGGLLIITLDNAANPCVWLRNALPFRFLNRLGIVPYYVGATCGPRRLCRYLAESGMEVNDVSAIMHCPRVIAVAVARILSRPGNKRKWAGFLRLLMAFERLNRLPTRFLTGYFVAVRATKN